MVGLWVCVRVDSSRNAVMRNYCWVASQGKPKFLCICLDLSPLYLKMES